MLQTGVENLDLILGGGLPEGHVMLFVGAAGTGKTTLAFQIAFHTAASGDNVLYISTLSEPITRITKHLSAFAFFDEAVIGKHLFLLSIYPLITQGLEKVADALIQAVTERQAKLLILDGLMSIRDLHPQVAEQRLFIYTLLARLSALDVTTVLTSSGGEEQTGTPFPEFTMADGVIELAMRDAGSRTVRTVRSRKMRSLPNLLGQHALRMDRRGLAVFPAFESVPLLPRDVGPTSQRVSTGLPELDKLMLGGPLAGSVTTLAGASGTGKTTACLQFLIEGLRQGQKCLFVGFRETPQELIEKARLLGQDLASSLKDGRLTILHQAPVGLVGDEVAWEIRRSVERLAPARLALDSADELERTFSVDRRRDLTASLVELFRHHHVTALISKEVPQIVGPELDFADKPIALLAENLVLLRYVEFKGQLFRILSILKMRDSDHDHSLRQYAITDRGFRVLSPIESAEGIMTGIARLSSEARVKRRAKEVAEEDSLS